MDQQRSRSQTRIPIGQESPRLSPQGRNQRSRSLDLRRDFDDDYFENRFARTPQPPGPGQRTYDYEHPEFRRYGVEESPRGRYDDRDRPSPRNGPWPPQQRADYTRESAFNQSRDFREDFPPPQQGFPPQQQGQGGRREDFREGYPPPPPQQREVFSPRERYSPRETYPVQTTPSPQRYRNGFANTWKKGNERNGRVERSKSAFSAGFGRKKEKLSPRSIEYPPEDPRDPRLRREEWAVAAAQQGGAGAAGGQHYHQSYYHERHGAGGAQSAGTIPRKPLYGPDQQSQAGYWSTQQKYQGGTLPRRQHYKIHCCCLTFHWPPWSFEPAEPPQPMYRNI